MSSLTFFSCLVIPKLKNGAQVAGTTDCPTAVVCRVEKESAENSCVGEWVVWMPIGSVHNVALNRLQWKITTIYWQCGELIEPSECRAVKVVGRKRARKGRARCDRTSADTANERPDRYSACRWRAFISNSNRRCCKG